MAIAGDKIGPGPATVNIRDFRPIPKKANNLPKSRRHIGEPNPSWAAPGQYHQDSQQKQTCGIFARGDRNVDFIKQSPGFEVLTKKGLLWILRLNIE